MAAGRIGRGEGGGGAEGRGGKYVGGSRRRRWDEAKEDGVDGCGAGIVSAECEGRATTQKCGRRRPKCNERRRKDVQEKKAADGKWKWMKKEFE